MSDVWENIPYSDLINEFFATKPSEVDGIMNKSSAYYQEFMIKKVLSIFDWGGIPDNWDPDYMQMHLFLDGSFIITDTEVGVIPLNAGLTGHNVFNQPTTAVVANVVLGNFERTIDETCALVKLQYNYCGIGNILRRYAAMLAMCDSSICVNLMNSKVSFIGLAESKAQANTMKKMYDDISCGKPAVFVKETQVNEASFFFNHVKENFVADTIQDLKRSIINEFLSEIGINNQNIEKKERLITDEVNANNDEIESNVTHWLLNIRKGLKKANELYGLNLSVKLRSFTEGAEDQKDEPKQPLSMEQ